MTNIFVDTDILIDYTKGHGKVIEHLIRLQKAGGVELFVNPVVVTEFLTDNSLVNDIKYKYALDFLTFFSLKDITKSVGILAARLLRNRNVTQLGDALIAATCLTGKFFLITRNRRHFNGVPKLQFYESDK